jgi:hypothetical protein
MGRVLLLTTLLSMSGVMGSGCAAPAAQAPTPEESKGLLDALVEKVWEPLKNSASSLYDKVAPLLEDDFDIEDYEHLRWLAEAHDIMQCNSPFRGIFGYVSVEPKGLHSLLAERSKALPAKLPIEAFGEVLLLGGYDLDLGLTAGAIFFPIRTALGELGMEVMFDEPGTPVHEIWVTPEIPIHRLFYVGGYANFDFSDVGIYIGGGLKKLKVGGLPLQLDGGIILSFDPYRFANLLDPAFWRFEKVGTCGEYDHEMGQEMEMEVPPPQESFDPESSYWGP